MDITGLGSIADAIKTGINTFFPNKTEIEKQQLAQEFALLQGQLNVNQAEAASTDPLQHWRGGMGWVCVLGYFHNFIFQPLFTDVVAMMGKTGVVLPQLDIGPLATLTLGMLGLGGLHVAELASDNKGK